MAFSECENGHIYDTQQYTSCPYCKNKEVRIEWDKNSSEFIVTDIGSSYGTFLSNNTKFEVNVPKRLKAGESIYLGEAANVIRLEVR